MRIKLKDIKGVFWIDRDEAVKHLTDGFVEIFGEENREFLENIQDEMIDEGIKAGRTGYWRGAFASGIPFLFPYKQKNDESMSDEDRDNNKRWFLKFFSEEEYELALSEDRGEKISGGSTGSIYPYYKNGGKYEKMMIDRFSVIECNGGQLCKEKCYCNTQPPKIYKKSPPSFKYFKSLKHSYMGGNMYGESGLNLDRWNRSEMNYLIEENEWFYLPESMHRCYYYLGAQIGKCQLKEEFLNKVIDNLEADIPYEIGEIFKKFLDQFSTDYDENILVPLLREEYKNRFDGELNIKTSKEVSESLKKIMTKEKKEELINLFKKRKL